MTIQVQLKSGKQEAADEKLTVEEVALKYGGRRGSYVCYSSAGKALQPNKSFKDQGVQSGDTVMYTI